MRFRRALLGIAIALVAYQVLAFVATSGAAYVDVNVSNASISAASVESLLSLYSQSTDPDGLTGYFAKAGKSTPAASGAGMSLKVDLGAQRTASTDENMVFTIKAPDTFPVGVSTITVTATLVTDPATGVQPITSVGFSKLGGNTRDALILGPSAKAQCNIQTKLPKKTGAVYHSTVVITVTYDGYSGSFFQYSVPVTITAK
jgi:hypothetical protein